MSLDLNGKFCLNISFKSLFRLSIFGPPAPKHWSQRTSRSHLTGDFHLGATFTGGTLMVPFRPEKKMQRWVKKCADIEELALSRHSMHFSGMTGLWNTGILWNTAPWQTFIAFHHGSTARSKAAAWRLTIASWLNFFQSSGRMMGPFSPFKLPYINHYNYDCNYINQWLNLYCCLL